VERPGRAAAVAGDARGAVDRTVAAVEMTGIQVPVERLGRAAAVVAAVRGADETTGTPVETEVEIAGGGMAKIVPDETVWAEAEDDSAAAARMPIRSVFTGTWSILNRFSVREEGRRAFPYNIEKNDLAGNEGPAWGWAPFVSCEGTKDPKRIESGLLESQGSLKTSEAEP
jgi:hypothetical protein